MLQYQLTNRVVRRSFKLVSDHPHTGGSDLTGFSIWASGFSLKGSHLCPSRGSRSTRWPPPPFLELVPTICMDRKQVQSLFGNTYNLKIEYWGMAYAIAQARVSNMDGRRSRGQDRGDANIIIDVQGAMGELLLRKIMRQTNAEFDHFISLDIPKGGDCILPHMVIDAKMALVQNRYLYMAINKAKHEKCVVDAYACFLAELWGDSVQCSKLVPYNAVEGWPEKKLRKAGSVAKVMRLDQFSHTYCKQALHTTMRYPLNEVVKASQSRLVRMMLDRVEKGLPRRICEAINCDWFT